MKIRNSFEKLEVAFIEAVKEMREQVALLDDCPSYFDFEISANGRVLDGDLEIKCKFDGGSYSKTTQGGRINATFEEYLRRYGWQKQNDAICLPRAVPVDEEIPF